MIQKRFNTWNTYDFYKRNQYINYNYWIYQLAFDLRLKNREWGFIEWVIRKNGKKAGWNHLLYYRASDEFILMVEKNVNEFIDRKLGLYE